MAGKMVMYIHTYDVKHLKTGNIYEVLELGDIIDCTNERDGTPVVVYKRNGQFYVREKDEFERKFMSYF